MACARCDFYTPKNSSRGQLLEAKENLQMMLANIPLTDDERAALDDGQAALGQFLERLTDVLPQPDRHYVRSAPRPPQPSCRSRRRDAPTATVRSGKAMTRQVSPQPDTVRIYGSIPCHGKRSAGCTSWKTRPAFPPVP